jgi:2-polyprenyl-6-methoxyphenol hydroxylase-like FAD-dependent oxidoreductase
MGKGLADPRILIIGAGPVGLTAAVEFARRGYRPRIVDTAPGPVPPAESRALAINVRSLQLLEPSGVTERILAEALQVRQLRLSAGSRRLATIDTTEVAGRFRGMHVLPQGRTQRILLDRLSEYGVAPEWSNTFEGFDDGESRSAALRLPDGTRDRADFDILVGADGAHSAVREAAGLTFPGEALTETFYLADYRYKAEIDASYVEARFFDPGVIARIPVDRHTLRFVSTLADFRERIHHPTDIEDVTWVSDFRVSFRQVEPMGKDNVFLVGDAAHIHSPVGGRGMNLGMEDACWLAWFVSEGRETEYSALRVPAARRVLADTYRMTRLALIESPIARTLRNLLLPALAAPPWLRRQGVRSALGLDTAPAPWLG